MKRIEYLITIFFAVIIATVGSAWSRPPQEARQRSEKVTMLGCVAPGSISSVFLLRNARPEGDREAAPRDYRLVTGDLTFARYRNHEVRVTGVADVVRGRQQVREESELPELRVDEVTVVSETCTAGRTRDM